MTRRCASMQELHVRVRRLVVDADARQQALAPDFEAELRDAIARQLDDVGHPDVREANPPVVATPVARAIVSHANVRDPAATSGNGGGTRR